MRDLQRRTRLHAGRGAGRVADHGDPRQRWPGKASTAWSARATSARSTAERTLRLTTVLASGSRTCRRCTTAPSCPALQFDGATLRLTRSTPEGAQVVVWSLREGVWRRWASPSVRRAFELQQAWLRSQQLIGNEDRPAARCSTAPASGRSTSTAATPGPTRSRAATSCPPRPRPRWPPAASSCRARRCPAACGWSSTSGERRLTRDVALGPTQP